MAVPGKVRFLNCKVLSPQKFRITWAWPLVDTDTEGNAASDKECTEMMDSTITHAVIEYKQGVQLQRTSLDNPAFIYDGMFYKML